MIDHTDPIWRLAAIFLASLAGGISALAFMRWREMKRGEIVLTVFVGTTFSLFVVPWITQSWFGLSESALRGIVACCYIGAAGAFTFIPALIRKAVNRGESL